MEPMGWERLKERLKTGERDEPEFSEDIVAFRRPDGLMRSFFQAVSSTTPP
jgi:hypothetical protein